jgi:hypothetical protein
MYIQLPNDHDHKGPLRTTGLNIVELDTYSNYRDRTLYSKNIYFIWYTDTPMKNLLNFENEFGTLYHLKAGLFKINIKTANNKKNNNSNNKLMFVINNPKGTHL